MFNPTKNAINTTTLSFNEAKELLHSGKVLFYPGHESMPTRVEFRIHNGIEQIRDEDFENGWQDYNKEEFLENLEDSCN